MPTYTDRGQMDERYERTIMQLMESQSYRELAAAYPGTAAAKRCFTMQFANGSGCSPRLFCPRLTALEKLAIAG